MTLVTFVLSVLPVSWRVASFESVDLAKFGDFNGKTVLLGSQSSDQRLRYLPSRFE